MIKHRPALYVGVRPKWLVATLLPLSMVDLRMRSEGKMILDGQSNKKYIFVILLMKDVV